LASDPNRGNETENETDLELTRDQLAHSIRIMNPSTRAIRHKRRRVTIVICLVLVVMVLSSCGPSSASEPIDPNIGRYGTWSWDGSKWSELAPISHGKTWYADQLFYSADLGGLINLNGTRWNGTAWAVNEIAFSLPVQTNDLPASMVVDEANGQLLFMAPKVSQMFAWSQGSWTSVVSPSQWPTANALSAPLGGIRVGAVAYDPKHHVVLMLSCCSPETAALDRAIWRTSAWDGHTMIKVSESLDLVGNFLVPDGRGDMLAFGPKGFSWDGRDWTPLPAESALPAGVESIAADPAHQQIIAVGQGRTWLWHAGTWDLIQTADAPPKGAMSNVVYDPILPGFVVTVLAVECCMANLP
jgi:hypothetical protein